ncbi:zf-TFIIB domain-containing protein [soil metagenome]
MKCPHDGNTLVMSERSGIEIDYCPECRGVWLDRGELDKILDRASAAPAAAQPLSHQPEPVRYQRQPEQPQYARKKKRESWLSEIFD